jgi:hypothetical protein
MSDELGEIIRILKLITIDDVLLNEFDEDEQHNLKKLLVKKTIFSFISMCVFFFCHRKLLVIVYFKLKIGYQILEHYKAH